MHNRKREKYIIPAIFSAMLILAFFVSSSAVSECPEGDCGNGRGVRQYADGGRYIGDFSGGLRHGSGTMTYPDGSAFSGEWNEDRRNGPGLSLGADGGEFSGNFIDDRPEGPGSFILSDGRVKKVFFKNGKLVTARWMDFEKTAGAARYGAVLALGGVYTGWYCGHRAEGYLPVGRGRIRWEDGCTYSGEWVNGKMHGRGAMTWEDGSSYVGQWVMGKRCGFGTYTWKSGSRYMGGWKDNQKDGPGVASYADGSVQRGYFRADRFLGSTTVSHNVSGPGKFTSGP